MNNTLINVYDQMCYLVMKKHCKFKRRNLSPLIQCFSHKSSFIILKASKVARDDKKQIIDSR